MKGSIGKRAVDEILRKTYGKCDNKEETERLGIYRQAYLNWKRGIFDPSSYHLQRMALAGYDVHYILTGERLWNTNKTNRFPAVDAVEVVHGEWIHHYFDSGEPIDDKWYCSECHMCNDHRRTWYCPNCGAKMDGERKENG